MAWLGGVLWWIVLGALAGWLVAWWIGRSTQRLLTEPVIQIIERTMDNPRHIARIATLEVEAARVGELQAQVATMPAMQARIDALLATPPRVVEKVVNRTVDRVIEKPVERIVERIVEKPVDRIVERLVEKLVERVVDRPVPDVEAIAERDAALRSERQRIEHLEALAAVQADRLAAAGDVVTVGATNTGSPA